MHDDSDPGSSSSAQIQVEAKTDKTEPDEDDPDDKEKEGDVQVYSSGAQGLHTDVSLSEDDDQLEWIEEGPSSKFTSDTENYERVTIDPGFDAVYADLHRLARKNSGITAIDALEVDGEVHISLITDKSRSFSQIETSLLLGSLGEQYEGEIDQQLTEQGVVSFVSLRMKR